MRRFLVWKAYLLLGVSLFFSTAAPGTSVNQSFTYSGQLMDSSGTPINSSSVSFTLEILDPSEACVLLKEIHSSVDLSATNGFFSLKIGTGARDGSDAGNTMPTVFNNANSLSGISCGYTPSPGDHRVLRVTVNDGAFNETLSPNLVLSSVPSAFVAESLQGKDPSAFVQTDPTNVTQTNMTTLTDGTDTTLHVHDTHNDGRYLQIGSSTSQNLGSGTVYTTGQLGVGTSSPTAGTNAEIFNSSGSTLRMSGDTGSNNVVEFYESGSEQASLSSQGGSFNISSLSAITMSSGGMPSLSISSSQDITAHSHLLVTEGLGLGQYTNSEETSFTGTLGLAHKGYVWMNTEESTMKYWDGASARSIASMPSSAASGDLVYVDATTGEFVSLPIGASGEVLKSDGSTPFWDTASASLWTENLGDISYSSGRVGIGTSSPNTDLDVSGTTRSIDIHAEQICDETGVNCKDISTGWASSGVNTLTANAPINNSGTAADPVLNLNFSSGLTTMSGSLAVEIGPGLIFSSNQVTVNTGTGPGNIVQLGAAGELPSVDGNQLTNVNAAKIQGTSVTSPMSPSNGHVLTWNGVSGEWQPQSLPGPPANVVTTDTTQTINAPKDINIGSLASPSGESALNIVGTVATGTGGSLLRVSGDAAGSTVYIENPATSGSNNTVVIDSMNSGKPLSVKTGGTEFFTAANTQRVGISRPSPAAKLDVNGEVRIGNSGVGCAPGNEGSLRYNSATLEVQFCNGTLWKPVDHKILALRYSVAAGQDGSEPTVSTGSPMPYPSEEMNTFPGTPVDVSSGFVFTAPITGQYRLAATFYGEENYSTGNLQLFAEWGSLPKRRILGAGSDEIAPYITGSTVIKMTTGETLRVVLQHNFTGDVTLETGTPSLSIPDAAYNYVEIEFLGR